MRNVKCRLHQRFREQMWENIIKMQITDIQMNHIPTRIEIQKLINTSYTNSSESKYVKKKNLILFAHFGKHA